MNIGRTTAFLVEYGPESQDLNSTRFIQLPVTTSFSITADFKVWHRPVERVTTQELTSFFMASAGSGPETLYAAQRINWTPIKCHVSIFINTHAFALRTTNTKKYGRKTNIHT
uniref:Uncharacterized protein n=1 Tax=Schistocephalus solidus TaxID=70667 RepID=A0A0V0J602_SCHSO